MIKTFKDICEEVDYDYDPLDGLNNLKTEAIKWIKNLQCNETEYPLVLEKFPDDMKGSAIKDLWYETEFRLGTEYGMIAWIMNFFNITEEELK